MSDTCYWVAEVGCFETCNPVVASLYVEIQNLLPITTGESSYFTPSVDIDGDYAIAGDDDYPDGRAFIYHRVAGVWSQQAELTVVDDENSFGAQVAISGDWALVGAPGANLSGPIFGAGQIYAFSRSGTTWTQQQVISPPTAIDSGQFGAVIAVSGDYMAVGFRSGTVPTYLQAGLAYVYMRSGGTWSLQDTVSAGDPMDSQRFGCAVAISGDTMIVGAEFDDSAGADTGAAYIFTRTGAVWSQQQKLTASDAGASEFFGTKVSLAGDYAVVGAASGAYVYFRSGSTWAEQWKFIPEVGLDQLFFTGGAISPDAAYVAISGFTSTSQPRIYIYSRNGSTWNYLQTLSASNIASLGYFGTSMSMDGADLLVGSLTDSEVSMNLGGANIYTRE